LLRGWRRPADDRDQPLRIGLPSGTPDRRADAVQRHQHGAGRQLCRDTAVVHRGRDQLGHGRFEGERALRLHVRPVLQEDGERGRQPGLRRQEVDVAGQEGRQGLGGRLGVERVPCAVAQGGDLAAVDRFGEGFAGGEVPVQRPRPHSREGSEVVEAAVELAAVERGVGGGDDRVAIAGGVGSDRPGGGHIDPFVDKRR